MNFVDKILSGENEKRPELYEALGCDRKSTTEQITAEYRARVKFLHPDKLLDEIDQQKREQYLQLQNAYTTLVDPEQRKCYDAWLECLLPLSYEEFKRNKDAVKVSMHWITPQQTPMISHSEDTKSQRYAESASVGFTRWENGRYESEAVRKFRNYEL